MVGWMCNLDWEFKQEFGEKYLLKSSYLEDQTEKGRIILRQISGLKD
jgi:hypothetical protein